MVNWLTGNLVGCSLIPSLMVTLFKLFNQTVINRQHLFVYLVISKASRALNQTVSSQR